MNKIDYILGIDGGGTNTQVYLFNSNGETISELSGRGTNLSLYKDLAINRLIDLINEISEKSKISLSEISAFGFGLAGVSDEVFGLATLVLLIPVFIPSIAVAARRLHDINQSGWMQCIFIPGFFGDMLLGTGYVIYILTFALYAFWFSQAGKKGKNRFGAQPRK